ncbi:MAG: hypothetical protein QOC93_2992 [Actinomycetota bacterium]|jgi:hypothetical protein|nr:hypothetical protein [Cryptosporangiaceae bacterium]MDQ1677848.1 hypothetical protein [Actinomycetota bacterium]
MQRIAQKTVTTLVVLVFAVLLFVAAYGVVARF